MDGDLWSDIAEAGQYRSVTLLPEDQEEATRLEALGLIFIEGNQVWLSSLGIDKLRPMRIQPEQKA